MSEQQPSNNSNTVLWIAIGGGVLLVCICLAALAVVGAAGFITARAAEIPSIATSIPGDNPLPAPTFGLPPTINAQPPPEFVEQVVTEMEQAVIPPRDRYDLASRFLGIDDATVTPPGEFQVGDRTSFWVDNDDTGQTVEVEAELIYKTEHVYMFVEVGQSFDRNGLIRSADQFEEETYPTNRSNFGSEPNPGIDSDPHLFILHTEELGSGIAGYFYSPSEYPSQIVQFSNEKEIFFINISNTFPGTDNYDSVLSHEFQHMIHWNVDSNEESWMNEGLSEVASTLNGFGPSGFIPFYFADPDVQLTDWPENESTAPHYAAGYLFNLYYLDRFGQDALRALVAHPENGLTGIDDALSDLGDGFTADEVFGDWVIANFLNDRSIAPEYGYVTLRDLPPAALAETVSSIPTAQQSVRVHQYGADYILLDQPGTMTITFDGSRQVRIIPTDTVNTDADPATDDSFVWWSNRADDSNMTLTRTLDLTDAQDPVLEYDLWYWIEQDFDYGYVEVSTDGGQRWEVLTTPNSNHSDPHGNSYGPAYTGQSSRESGASATGWLHESIDLSAYTGQQIQLRFELISDDAVNQPGLVIDNVCVAAINWCDDAEATDSGWEVQGWVRQNNILPQTFLVQVIVPGANGDTQVLPVPLGDANHGEITITVAFGEPATLVVSGLTHHTTEQAVYSYTVSPAN